MAAKFKKLNISVQTDGAGARAPDVSADIPNINNSDPYASYKVSEEGTLNLMSQSFNEYAINEEGLQVGRAAPAAAEDAAPQEKTYRCASSEMCVFGAIGSGASSVVRKAIHIPTHRILALKKINVFEKDKRHQLLNEIKTLCEAQSEAMPQGLVEFYGAFYQPDSGQISIALEYMDGGSLADLVQLTKTIPEDILSAMTKKVLQGMVFLHQDRRMVHRDIKPANLLMNLNGDPKITDFGISTGLDHSLAMCATFVGTVTYMSPERIANQNYSFPADIWSLGLALLECGTGTFPYSAEKGPVNLMLQVMEDPAPTLPEGYSEEFQSFVNDCLEKDPFVRKTAEQLLNHPFITRYDGKVDLSEYIQKVIDPTERLKDLSNMFTVHYYMLFDGPDTMWPHMESFYRDDSTLMFGQRVYTGPNPIFLTLTSIRSMMSGEQKSERLVHTIDNLECCAYGKKGLMIRVSGSLVVGRTFIPPPDTQVEGVPNASAGGGYKGHGKKLGTFIELFVFEPGEASGQFLIAKQELYVQK